MRRRVRRPCGPGRRGWFATVFTSAASPGRCGRRSRPTRPVGSGCSLTSGVASPSTFSRTSQRCSGGCSSASRKSLCGSRPFRTALSGESRATAATTSGQKWARSCSRCSISTSSWCFPRATVRNRPGAHFHSSAPCCSDTYLRPSSVWARSRRGPSSCPAHSYGPRRYGRETPRVRG